MPDLISIIMPVYNAAPFLHHCLASIKQQKYTNWELIAVDDFSTDASLRILEEASFFDSRIKVFKNSEKGIIPALILSFKNVSGIFVTRMDADDIMPPHRLSTMVGVLKKEPPKTVTTGLVTYFSESEVSEGYQSYQNWINSNILSPNPWKSVYRECIIASPCWMVKTKDLEAIGGFDNLQYPEDYDLVFKWYKHGFNIKPVAKSLLYWREHPLRTSRNSDNYAQKAFFKLKVTHFIQNELNGEELVVWGTGVKGRLIAKILIRHKVSFLWMDLQAGKYPSGIFHHPILPFTAIENLSKPKLILAVYPPRQEMNKMESYLDRLGLKEAKNYWYF